MSTPKGMRVHIGLFGRRNAGKSSLFNALLHQKSGSIVSDQAGTTTDPVERAMEIQPIGPVLFVDTAGVDDTGSLGEMRVAKTLAVIERVDVAVLVTDGWSDYEQNLVKLFKERKTPVVIAASQCDRLSEVQYNFPSLDLPVVFTSALSGLGVETLREKIAELTPESAWAAPCIVSDLVRAGDLVLLVTPIDKEAPKGRLILPQVQTIRDLLDGDCMSLVVKERELASALKMLKVPPALVVTDSQAFLKVSAHVPASIRMTGFSILFARLKGDLTEFVRGAMAIESLKPNARVLIAETCTHHAVADDIGRVKIPRWLEQYAGGKINIEIKSGRDVPEDISKFDLIVHCGSCMGNRKEMLSKIRMAREAGVPITNYGLAIAYCQGIFERALQPFPMALEAYYELCPRKTH